jgi:tripartite-type tricarboxylate transporter receptor subunit TctC
MKRLITMLGLCVAAAGTQAQSFPVKPVRLIVAFPPGGTTDTIARTFGQKLTEAWKQQVVVENRGGAGGTIAADVVAKSAPNGYTVMLNTAAQAIAAAMYRKLPFDPVKDFTPLTQLTATYLILTTRLPVGSVKELVALAKAQPGRLNFGSNGVGSTPHLAGEYLKSIAGIEAVHIPYKGDALLTSALLAEEVQYALLPTLMALQQIRAGKLRGLAISGPRRNAAEPNIPTVMESGVPGFEFSGWIGIFGPGGMPRDLAAYVSSEFVKVLNMPDVAERLRTAGNDIAGTTPEEFDARYKADIGVYARIMRDAKMPPVD